MKIKVGDQVLVIAGKDKGKSGKVISTNKKDHKVVVENINMHKKHQKPNNTNEKGSIIDIALPIDVSNVKKIDKATKEKTAKKETKKVEEKKATKKTTKKETK
ncbi:MAG: 50S ribosomal protein L24 [Bacilli bacterium]|nr:50S ribosomal protein L24 [Bacilli bacterium]